MLRHLRLIGATLLLTAAWGQALDQRHEDQSRAALDQWREGRALFLRETLPGVGAPTHVLRRRDGRPALDLGRAFACALCHNVPLGDGGAGATILRAGAGRSTPHLFGAGAREQVAQAIAADLMAAADRTGDGLVGPADRPFPPAEVQGVSFGRWDDGRGRPDLDAAIVLRPLAAKGMAVAAEDARFVGWAISVPAFGWGEDAMRPALDGTALRSFISGAFAQHAGLQADDPAAGLRSPLGAALLPHAAIDPGRRRDAAGVSRDDPDGDGVLSELRSADITALERFHLDHPEPPPPRLEGAAAAGRQRFEAIGCATCHRPDWAFPAVADRRALAWTWTATGAWPAPRPPGPLAVTGIYSDFRSHDLGPALHLVHDDGTVIMQVRTPPLWGVASSGPWLHDGRALDLDDAVRAHGGDAAASAAAYADDAATRDEVLAFLLALRLRAVGSATP